MNSFKPNKQRALIATSFIWSILGVRISFIIIAALNVILVSPKEIAAINSQGASYAETYSETDTYSGASSSINYKEKPKRIAEIIRMSDVIVGVLYKLLLLGSIITFIMWFRRAYYNLHLRVPNLKYKEGWAAGGWFIPIVCLDMPFQIMKELYTVTKGLLQHRKGFSASWLSTRLLTYWWTLWLGYWILERIAKKWMVKATVDEIIPLSIFYFIVYTVGVLSAFVTIKVINNYSKAEQLLTKDEADDEFEPETILAYDAGF